MINPSPRIENVKYAIRNIVVEAQKLEKVGQKILYLNIGDPCKFDFAPPAHIVDAVYSAMLDGYNGYTHSYGIPAARKAIAADEIKKGKRDITEEDIIVTSGASEAIELTMTALCSPGENILTPSPGYPLYSALAAKLHLEENSYPLIEETGWQPDVEAMEKKINKKTRAIVLINPNNPTGAIYSTESLRAILELAIKHNLVVLSDEIYSKLYFENPPIPIAALTDEVPIISFDGLSKSHLVPGWRIGWMAFSNRKKMEKLITAIKKLADARLCAPGPQQYAIKAALEGDQTHVKHTIVKLRERDKVIRNALTSIPGMHMVAPSAAFYSMVRFNHPQVTNDEEFVLKLLKETGVLVVHGSGFGYDKTKGTFRIVFLPPPNVLEEAGNKIKAFVEKHYK